MTERTTAGPRPAEPDPATQDKETVTDQSQPGAVADVSLTAAAAVARPAAATGG
jgi:hypothetical protein